MIALAIFVVAGLTILRSVDLGASAVAREAERARAVDLARSAMSAIEAGLLGPEALNGPAPGWRGDGGPFLSLDSTDADAPDATAAWDIAVRTEPAEFPGLTRVSVTVSRADDTGATVVRHSLVQLVRLGVREDDRAGEEGELGEAARRGAERPTGRPSRREGER